MVPPTFCLYRKKKIESLRVPWNAEFHYFPFYISQTLWSFELAWWSLKGSRVDSCSISSYLKHFIVQREMTHPHVVQQGLTCGLGDELFVVGLDRQQDTRGRAPVFQFTDQEALSLPLLQVVTLVQHGYGKIGKFSASKR